MRTIEKIDPNFTVQTAIDRPGIKFYPANSDLFSLGGVFWRDGRFHRMPADAAKQVSGGVYELHTQTAGGRLRLCTTSSYVAISARMGFVGKMPHFALTGSAGFDLYERISGKQVYMGSFIPPFDVEDHFESIVELGNSGMHELTIHFPLYSGVDYLHIGLEDTAIITPAPSYTHPKPVVFYGSSITQGGCASRPGNAYPNMLSLMLDCDHINLGFSGCAKAEDAMAEYINALDMSILVYDYDYNAPDPEYLEITHEKMFRKIRATHPNLPIVMISLPKIPLPREDEREQRWNIIRRTYENAVTSGDRNVYLLSGTSLLGDAIEAATVDNCHPNDIGFYFMAARLAPLILHLLENDLP